MSVNALIRIQDLVNNPVTRIPVCLCLDTSASMMGPPIEELNHGVQLFFNSILEDTVASYAAEICVVTFGVNVACIADFATLKIQPNAPLLQAAGMTPMGEAINLALDLLEARKEEYKDKGVDYYQPWLVLMTDGVPNGDPLQLARAENRLVDLVNERKLTIFPIGIGSAADMATLEALSPRRKPLKLQGLKFNEFFAWLSKSVSQTSQSRLGDIIPLDSAGITSWGEL